MSCYFTKMLFKEKKNHFIYWGLRHKCGFKDKKSLLTVARGSHNVQEVIDELDNSLHYVWQREGRYSKEGQGGRRWKRSRGWGATSQDISLKTVVKDAKDRSDMMEKKHLWRKAEWCYHHEPPLSPLMLPIQCPFLGRAAVTESDDSLCCTVS